MKTAQPGIMDIILRPFIGFADTFFGYFKNGSKATPKKHSRNSSDEEILQALQRNISLIEETRSLIPVLNAYNEAMKKIDDETRQQIAEMKELIKINNSIAAQIDNLKIQLTQQHATADFNSIDIMDEEPDDSYGSFPLPHH